MAVPWIAYGNKWLDCISMLVPDGSGEQVSINKSGTGGEVYHLSGIERAEDDIQPSLEQYAFL